MVVSNEGDAALSVVVVSDAGGIVVDVVDVWSINEAFLLRMASVNACDDFFASDLSLLMSLLLSA